MRQYGDLEFVKGICHTMIRAENSMIKASIDDIKIIRKAFKIAENNEQQYKFIRSNGLFSPLDCLMHDYYLEIAVFLAKVAEVEDNGW